MDAINFFAQASMKKNAPDVRVGDTVRVHQKIREGNKERIQVFEGLVIAMRGNKAINSSFVVRYIHKGTGVGVEKTFPLHSPNVVKVERVKSSPVHQARLYYMRERFGRRARMRGESWSSETWEETKDEPVMETTEADAPAEEEVTAPDEVAEAQEAEVPTDEAPAEEAAETEAGAPAEEVAAQAEEKTEE